MVQNAHLAQCFEDTRALEISGAGDALTVPLMFLDALTRCKTRSDVLEVYSVWAGQLTNADRCSVTLRVDNEWLMITAMDGTKKPPENTTHPLQNSTVGAVYERGEPLFLHDVTSIDLPDAKVVAELGLRSAVLAPIISGAHCFGTLAASYKETMSEPAAELALIQAMARCLAMQLRVIEQMQSLTTMARTDPLTGAGNRYDLYEQAEEAWTNWTTDAQPFSFMSTDIDHFKQINDTYGHDVGDAVLCAFVQRLKGQLRATDKIIRTGGEEFGLLMPDPTPTSAIERAQRLCDVIGDRPFAVHGMELVITASFGITQVVPSDQSFDDVLKRADIALYDAKKSGRDQVISISDEDLAA